jgi:hypothetical protein
LSYKTTIDKLLPENLKDISSSIALNIANQSKLDVGVKPNGIDLMQTNLDSIVGSIKIQHYIRVDENKFYITIDAAYKIYQELTKNKIKHAWLIANMTMLKWFLKNITGKTVSGLEIQRETDAALRSPTLYLIKHILLSIFTLGATIGTMGYYTFKSYNADYSENPTLKGLSYANISALGYLVISIIINTISLYRKTRKKEETIFPIEKVN